VSSPDVFLSVLPGFGAVFGSLGPTRVALHFGDPDRELRALREQAGLIDLSWRGAIEMTGRDRVRFLHGMCTNDIRKLAPGQGCLAAVVNRQGKMVAELAVYAGEHSLLLEVDRSNLEPTIEALGKFIVADDVSMKPADMAILGLYGPGARALLEAPSLAPFHTYRRSVHGVAADPALGIPGYHLLLPSPEPAEFGRLQARGAIPAGFQAYEQFRIENGFPRWGADMGPDLLPMEAGLESLAISYTKGCYIGQEVIQRVKTYSEPPRRLVLLEVKGASPAEKVTVEGQDVGRITSATPSRALGILRKEDARAGTSVLVEGRPGAVRDLPFQARLT
jgi:folate-binding protein YgfZ